MKGDVTLFGSNYSVYVRIVQLTLKEKGVPYRFVEVDVFGTDGPPADYLERHPFGRIPAFEYDGFRLFETAAITRYIDDAFNGPALMPQDSKKRARVDQITGLLDSYAYRAMVWDVFVERVDVPQEGGASDEEKIVAGLRTAETCLSTLGDLMGEDDYLVGSNITLADLHAAPMFAYFRKTPEGANLLARHPAIVRWWERLSRRPSIQALAE
ncbi:MAG: glutathione S-transferase family protein [Alphaproteobacteria bacterium]|jgi:glutathione S-transferase|nr:glutathione S-transferase family protein [Alphaproteobacteria bacterium]